MDINGILMEIAEKIRVKAAEKLRLKPISEDEGGRIDVELEEEAIRILREKYSDFTFIGEETGKHVHGSGKPIFIVDPLDGSINAYRGYPVYSTSIAIAEENNFKSIIGGIVENLVTGDIFIGVKGDGVKLNGRRIKPSKVDKLCEALIAVDMNIRGKYHQHLKLVTPIISEAKHVRFIGTDALETCFVAAGICDAFIDLRGILRLTDFAAACFMVKEAGGLVLDENGKPLNFEFNDNIRAKYIAVANNKLAMEIMDRIRRVNGEAQRQP